MQNSAKTRGVAPQEKTASKKASVIGVAADDGINEASQSRALVPGNIVKTQRIKNKILKPVTMAGGKDGKKKKDKPQGGKGIKKLKTQGGDREEVEKN